MSPPVLIMMPGGLTMNSLPCTMSASIRRTLEVITARVKSRVTRHICVRGSIRAGTSQRPCCTYLPACCLITSLSLAAAAFRQVGGEPGQRAKRPG